MNTHDKIAQIEQEIKDKQKELEGLKKQAERMDSKYPNNGDRFYVILSYNVIIELTFNGESDYKLIFDYGNGFKTEAEAKEKQEWNELDRHIREWIKGRIEYGRFIRQLYGKFIEESPGASSITTNDIVNEGLTEEKIRFWLENM